MFLSTLEPYAVVIIIVVVALQYAFALFCLLKLAYLDISKREYALWNLLILLVFFVGDIAFLIYYFKVGKNKRIPDYVPPVENEENKPETDGEEKPEEENGANAEATETTAEEKTGAPEEQPAEEKAEEAPTEQEEPEQKAKAPAKKKPAAKKKDTSNK